MSDRALEIIDLRNRERDKQATFRTLWQDTADNIFPRENQITTTTVAGQNKMVEVYDTTAIQDSQDMASGLSAALIPSSQEFFALKPYHRGLEKNEEVTRYLGETTEITHIEMFDSNFMLQFNETLRSCVVFGTGNLFSEFSTKRGKLNYKDFDIAMYQILEDEGGNVDTVILTFELTARQAVQKFGAKNLGEQVLVAYGEPKKQNDLFEFVHIVRPRNDRNPNYTDNLNMPFESIYVGVKDKMEVEVGGFEEFPFAVARWMKSSGEIYGRGQGTEVLSDVLVLQQMKQDFIECANKWNKPPLEVVSGRAEAVNLSPAALNWVTEPNAIRAIQQQAMGSFPITREVLEMQQEIVHKAFYRDIFVQLSELQGDRRTTVEIIERLKEGLRRLALPVARLQSELLNPVIERTVRLLIRNGRLPEPPLGLDAFSIEYKGELALALQNQKAQAALRFAQKAMLLSEVWPEAIDTVDIDDIMPDIAMGEGVKIEHISTEEEIAAKREARKQQQMVAQLREAAVAAGQAYSGATKAPEEGSAAEEVMSAVAGE